MLKISVATVCFNSAATIESTILSVINQTYNDIEYLIIDGKSSDETLSIVNSFADDNEIIVVSEPDKGLYDAMNKAADLASGDYILYMNSGDVFATNDVIEKVVPFLHDSIDMCYGNVFRIKEDGEHLEKYHGRHKELKLALQGKMMCHQSMFTKVEVMRKYRFNLEYSITADFDFVNRLLRDKKRIEYVDIAVSKVDNIEGISSSIENIDKMRYQDDLSIKRNFPIWYKLIWLPKKMFRAFKRIEEKKIR